MIIGIAGYAQTGKSTIANHLVESHAYVPLNFADAVRALTYEIDPLITPTTDQGRNFIPTGQPRRLSSVSRSRDYEWLKEHTDLRDFMVKLGHGARKVLHKNVWIDAMTDPNYSNIVIGDVRYANEAHAILKQKGFIWRVYRPDHGAINDIERESLAKFNCDWAIDNDRTVADLLLKVDRKLATLRNYD